MPRQKAHYKVLFCVWLIVLCEIVGLVGSLFALRSLGTWYKALVKPALTPPSWLFVPVWVVLYALMGIAAYIIWSKGFSKKKVRSALELFGVQLILNLLWTIAFFGFMSVFFGFVVVIALWVALLLTVVSFYKISKKAGTILVPYVVWVSIALLLNLSLLMLNH